MCECDFLVFRVRYLDTMVFFGLPTWPVNRLEGGEAVEVDILSHDPRGVAGKVGVAGEPLLHEDHAVAVDHVVTCRWETLLMEELK